MRHARTYLALAALTVAVLPLSSPAASGAHTTLIAGMPAWADVEDLAVSPTDEHVVFLADTLQDGRVELFSVELAQGAQPVLLSATEDGTPIRVARAAISPDGRTVAFAGDIAATGPVASGVWTVPIDGPATRTVRLSQPGSSIQFADQLIFTPDSTRLVYRWVDLNRVSYGFRSAPVDGPLTEVVALSTGGFSAQVSNDELLYGSSSLYRVPIEGPSSARTAIAPKTINDLLFSWRLAPDGRTVAYTAETNGGAENLYSVPIGGPRAAAVQLTDLAEDWHSVDQYAFAGSNRITYIPRTSSDVNDPWPLFSVAAAGPAGGAVQLNGGVGQDAAVERFSPTPDGSRIVFVARQTYEGPQKLVSVPAAGPAGAAQVLDGPGLAGEEFYVLGFSVDGRVVYEEYADFETEAIHSVPVDASRAPTELASTPDSARYVEGAPDAFYTDGGDLFRVPVTGPQSAAERVNDGLAAGGSVRNWQATSDGDIVVYVADQRTNGVRELFASGTLPLPGPGSGGTVERWWGPDRFATAAAISAANFSPGVDVAYIAVGLNFPDALAGGPVAGLDRGPILLTQTDAIPQATSDELRRLAPGGIVILGGTAAVDPSVAGQLATYTSGAVTRLAGSDRYATAAAISAANFDRGVDVAYVAVGSNFPDALAGGPVASLDGGPILLTQTEVIPRATTDELLRLAPEAIVILGGTAAVSASVASQLEAYTAGDVTRLDGSDRYGTATAIAKAAFGSGVDTVFVAVGTNFPDALAGGAPAGIDGAPILLTRTDELPAETVAELRRLQPTRIVILGGTAVVSPQVAAELAGFL